MKRTVVMPILALAMGIVLGVIANQGLNAQERPLKATLIFRADLVGMPGQEAVVQLVEFAPRGSSGKHIHPGHEVVYVLEGSGVKEAEGEGPAPMKAGTVTYVPAGKVSETKNGSATAPLKLLVFRVHPEGAGNHHQEGDGTLLPEVAISFPDHPRAPGPPSALVVFMGLEGSSTALTAAGQQA